jgi:pimeloyl-ACP methyl ester carboxylesterase
MMTNAAYALLSHSWSGLLIAVLVGGLGCLVVRLAHWLTLRWIRFIGYATYGLAVLLAIGSVVGIVRSASASSRYPPMGKLVDVGGYRMNILAEGDAHGGPTLVWITGGHDTGISLYHLHKVMRNETRSILFDRPGTGWSDTGPFPRTTAREAEELDTLLTKAGERGPFILLGHSYGGLLAANYARRHPERTAALVLLDATPPDSFFYSPGGRGWDAPVGMVRGFQIEGWMKLFGIWKYPYGGAPTGNAEMDKLIRIMNERLTDILGQLEAVRSRPDAGWTSASIFSEWFDAKSVSELVVYDGELGNLPVYNVHPADSGPPQAMGKALGISGKELDRFMRFMQHVRNRYMSISTKSVLIHTPAGTGHLFPYETPDSVLEVARRALAESRQANNQAERRMMDMSNTSLRVTMVNHNAVDIARLPEAVWQEILRTYLKGEKFSAQGYRLAPITDDLSAPLGGYRMELRSESGDQLDERVVRITEHDEAKRRLSLCAEYLSPAMMGMVVHASYQAVPAASGTRYRLDAYSMLNLPLKSGDTQAGIAAKLSGMQAQASEYLDKYLNEVKLRLEAAQ